MMLASLLIAGVLSVGPAAAPQGTCPQWEPMLRALEMPVKDFSRIMWRESRCDPSKVGDRNYIRPSVGLLQVQATWSSLTKLVCRTKKRPEQALLSPACNLAVAEQLYQISGFKPWKSTYQKKEK